MADARLCPRCKTCPTAPEHDCPHDKEVNNDLPHAPHRCNCCEHCTLNECQDSI